MKTIKSVALAGMILIVLFFNSCSGKKEIRVYSPDESYEFTCFLNEEANEIQYSLSFKGE